MVTRLKWKLDSVHLELVLILTQYRFMVYAEHTICLEVILETPDRTPRDVGHVESHFGPFGDSVN